MTTETTAGPARCKAVPEVIAAGSLLVLGLLYGVLAVGEGLGTMADTGAGFFPFIVALLLIASSATVLVRLRWDRRRAAVPTAADEDGADKNGADKSGADENGAGDVGVHWWRIAGVLSAALLVPAVGETVGMIVTLSFVLILIAKIMGLSRWTSAVILGVAFGAATWLIFVYWLLVPLPAGTLGLV